MGNGITIDNSQMRAALREYATFTKRDISTILNTKAFYVSRGAVGITQRVEAQTIKSGLEALIQTSREVRRKGKLVTVSRLKTVKRFSFNGAEQDVPLVALLENAARGRAGRKGLYGAKMKQAAKSIVARRVRSRAFIATGFLPAVKTFEPLAERTGQAPRRDPDAKQYGRPKGYGIAARDEWVSRATIANTAEARGDKKQALERYGGRALEQAMADEVRSMQAYIERKMQASADKVNSHH